MSGRRFPDNSLASSRLEHRAHISREKKPILKSIERSHTFQPLSHKYYEERVLRIEKLAKINTRACNN